MPFCRATDTSELLVTSILGFKARVGSLIFTCRGVHDVCSLRFTSGATSADLAAWQPTILIHILANKHWWGSRLESIVLHIHYLYIDMETIIILDKF